MKTPREILLARHRSAEPKLGALRKVVLSDLSKAETLEPHGVKTAPEVRWSLRELALSFRWHLAGMSAAWLLVVLLNSEQSPASAPTLARQGTLPPRQLLLALREHRRQLWELLQPPVTPPPLAVPHALAPPRRSEPAESLILA